MTSYFVEQEPTLRTFGLTRRAILLPLAAGGVGVALAVSRFFDRGHQGLGIGLVVGTALLIGTCLLFGANTRTVVRPGGLTLISFGRGSRTVEWARVLDIRISPAPGQAEGRGQAVLYRRAPDGSIEPLVVPHLSTYNLGSQLPSAVAYLNDQRLRAVSGRPLDVDPRGVMWAEQQRLTGMRRKLMRNYVIALAGAGVIVALVLALVIGSG